MQAELFWMQKFRCDYISFRDKNITYFHTRTMERRRRNKIITLKDSIGNWLTDEAQLKSMTINFLKSFIVKMIKWL